MKLAKYITMIAILALAGANITAAAASPLQADYFYHGHHYRFKYHGHYYNHHDHENGHDRYY